MSLTHEGSEFLNGSHKKLTFFQFINYKI